MREVNFSIPNANKASVGITTVLYDRRALDCTSTLPLINSLNNLAYLTTSSGRIRDILTVDGGIERLVCILKEGRSQDMMEMWKWNLAFQCIVNIGVRGSEAVRTRVVEADMVPVIATILDNYFQVIDKCRERAEAENRRKCPFGGSTRLSSRIPTRGEASDTRPSRARRNPPPPIAIPEPRDDADPEESAGEITPTTSTANMSLSSPPERTSFPRHLHQRSIAGRVPLSSPTLARQTPDPPSSATSFHDSPEGSTGIRPVRDIDRLPSMVPTFPLELSSQPQSPTTPHGPAQQSASRAAATNIRPRRRPSIRHQLSVSGSDDDGQIDDTSSEDLAAIGQPEPVVGFQGDIVMQDMVDDQGLLEPQPDGVTLAVPDVSSADDETFNITHPSTNDGSLVNGGLTQAPGPPGMATNTMPVPLNAINATPPNMHLTPPWYPPRGSAAERTASASIIAAMPRDEDVLMSLQLLAYVSKYCYLRSYFQQSRLVPRLKVGNDLQALDPDYNGNAIRGATRQDPIEEWDNEFVKAPGEKPYNIFPLIEKFTVKPSSSRHIPNPPASPQQGDMQYWAGVVMRNLCRKDESRGGIRQCAYWKCGKWEEYTRQFAKCRRCRRTKYCSKECQKGAWGSHRFWCVAAEPGDGEAGSSERGHHRHGHSHRSGQQQHHHHHQPHHHHHHHHHHHSHAHSQSQS